MSPTVKYMGMYDFVPSKTAAIVFGILFLVTTLFHLVQLIQKRTWFYIPFLIGCIFEVIGYMTRAVSATQYPDYDLGPEVIQYIMILVAPALLAASIYMEFGRLIIMTDGDRFCFIRRTWLTKIFVIGDIISFLAQFSGGAMLANDTTADKGQNIMKVGVVIQLLFFGVFITTIIVFNMRLSKQGSRTKDIVPWKRHMIALYSTGILILIRSIFRLIEFVESTDGPLSRYELLSYIFDAVMILITCVILNYIHPGEIKGYVKAVQSPIGEFGMGRRHENGALYTSMEL
ncbi:unnamed protein product [Penicillium salamii]|uniref:RTA-like protein n=1 Tax=Penicillium salamii TaxID=1612424 RepID=A0A9W4NZ09_9EURO|nr:unnamed protein product [Penicillium salamii]CAG8333226.1 unnamed protein product [Penicillium salamii]CAG8359947.1 unnamed protein product [Penicillium salamii]CAG8371872.1 unnamed protein product [Penicillium salamii]CAG8412544.1 unnamed protein product [Penicillium salamii]